jgi:hypothetical protein
MVYFLLAKELGFKPWDVDRMDATMVDDLLTIIEERGKVEADALRR